MDPLKISVKIDSHQVTVDNGHFAINFTVTLHRYNSQKIYGIEPRIARIATTWATFKSHQRLTFSPCLGNTGALLLAKLRSH